MPHGTLEVLLVGAKGLEDTDFLSNMDPYAVITCRTQERKSSVASDIWNDVFGFPGNCVKINHCVIGECVGYSCKGSTPEWNETFVFTISDGVPELNIKIMDSDSMSQDDFVGEATIPLEPLFSEGSIPPTTYNVVKDQEYRGEVRVGLTFTHQRVTDRGFSGEESFGGWKQSTLDY